MPQPAALALLHLKPDSSVVCCVLCYIHSIDSGAALCRSPGLFQSGYVLLCSDMPAVLIHRDPMRLGARYSTTRLAVKLYDSESYERRHPL
ncbi:hypothetical protein E2C01_097162 [Portunus trituberculatus]|uniref:Uncharacterized protein n=1 Tax=Portunus trituberculatus TaxID=210409 RepID=A0A5B7K3X9_PORTR|nr:hypothetical protein [Portunus trituberculatus]